MHPVVIMAYDKSPAINKAVAALEEAGMEVRVLNTNHAKLADFLGALAGDDEDDEDEDIPAAPSEDASSDGDAPPDDGDPPEDDEITIAAESCIGFIDGEEILVERTSGSSELYPSGLMVGSKTAYAINESHFSFWPVSIGDGMFDLTHNVQIAFDDKAVFENIVIKEAVQRPVLKLNKEVFDRLAEGSATTMSFKDKNDGFMGNYSFTQVKKHGQDGNGNTVYSGVHKNGHPSVFVVSPNDVMIATSINDGSSKTLDDAKKKADHQVENNKDGRYWDSKDPMERFHLTHRFRSEKV